MPRYERLAESDSDDDDSVALILNQRPRKHGKWGNREYIPLEDLDDQGTTENEARHARIHQRFESNIRKSSKLVLIIVGVILSITLTVALATLYATHRPEYEDVDDPPVLSEPLDLDTKFHNGTHRFKRMTLMISLDGLHPHYISKDRTPHLDEFARSGFAPPYIKPSFPSQTFPNHWTLVTGMYPANHGIVGNTFYDPELDLEFVNVDPTKSLDRRFWGGEPIWITARKHRIKSAVHMWPGSEANWGDDKPDEVDAFDAKEPLSAKRDKILSWLDREEPPQLMLAYVPTIDTVGHEHGISGSELVNACRDVDKFVGEVLEGVSKRNLTDILNVVILSDHGMAPISDDRVVFVDDVIANFENATSNRGWPMAGLRYGSAEEVEEAYDSAKDYIHDDESERKFSIYKSSNTPYRWHFRKPDDDGKNHTKKYNYEHRLASLYVVPEPGYVLVTHDEWDKMDHKYPLRGIHGYDNDAPTMRGAFMAQGPAFIPGRYEPFNNIDVYSAICRSLGFVESSESDGNFQVSTMPRWTSDEHYPDLKFDTPILEGSTFSDFFGVDGE